MFLRAFGRNEKTGLFSAISVISSERCSENYPSRGGARFEGDFMSQGFQALHQLTSQPCRLQAVQEVRAQLRVRRPPLQYVVDDHQQRVPHRYQRPLTATALGQPAVLR